MIFINSDHRKRNNLMFKNTKNTKNLRDHKIDGDEVVSKVLKSLNKSLMIQKNFVKNKSRIKTKSNYLVDKLLIQMVMKKAKNYNYQILRSLP